MAAPDLVDAIRAGLRAAAVPARAPAMQAYMKSSMPFLGVRLPDVRRVARAVAREQPPTDLAVLEHDVRRLWDDAEFREERYAASALTRERLALGRLELVPLIEHLTVTGAWWDHVDDLAHRVAVLHDAHPAETAAIARRWAVHDDLWLRRLAIIGQLGRKDRVDRDLLSEAIDASTAHRDFFVRKAIGWALRDHARTDPEWVRTFVADRADVLSPLSRREALKHVG